MSNRSNATFSNIDPADFLGAFDTFLCPWTNSTNLNTEGSCSPWALDFILTGSLYGLAYFSYDYTAKENQQIVDTLRNLFATSLFTFNPVFLSPNILQNNANFNTTIPGLPRENYFPGSKAHTKTYVAPAYYTVLAFVISGCILMTISVVFIAVSSKSSPPETSSFALVDGFKVTVEEAGSTERRDLDTFLLGKDSDSEIVHYARGATVRLLGDSRH